MLSEHDTYLYKYTRTVLTGLPGGSALKMFISNQIFLVWKILVCSRQGLKIPPSLNWFLWGFFPRPSIFCVLKSDKEQKNESLNKRLFVEIFFCKVFCRYYNYCNNWGDLNYSNLRIPWILFTRIFQKKLKTKLQQNTCGYYDCKTIYLLPLISHFPQSIHIITQYPIALNLFET